MKKILVLNNDPDTMELLKNLLQIKGYDAIFSAVREQIPQLLESFRPNLVLLDIARQEEMDEIRQEAATATIPVLLMTGHNSYPHNTEKGFVNFINKPFTMEELLGKIESILA